MAITSKVNITSFGLGEQPSVTSIELLGGKGAGLVYMSSMGVPVPPGFVIPTSVCLDYFKSPSATIRAVATAIKPYLKKMYDAYGYMPLVSVRSGARASMPGMMDTILNVGLDGSNAPGWITRIGAECVSDSRRRLIEMFASVVCGMPRSDFSGKSATECNDVFRASQGSDFPGVQVVEQRTREDLPPDERHP
jgi:pyruvate,orthophosphate dikinase